MFTVWVMHEPFCIITCDGIYEHLKIAWLRNNTNEYSKQFVMTTSRSNIVSGTYGVFGPESRTSKKQTLPVFLFFVKSSLNFPAI